MDYKSKFKSIFFGVVDIVSLIDTDYNILMVNNAFESLLKKSSENCIGQKCYYIMRNRKSPCEDCPILTNKNTPKITYIQIMSIGDENLEISRHPVYDNKGHVAGVFEIGKIITNKIKMEQELQHHSRLKIMGELAASITHEIKNPLVSIGLMFISIMERYKKCFKNRKVGDDLYQDMESILQEIQRLERLLESLTNFGKPMLFLTKKEDIHCPIIETLKLLNKKVIFANIKIKKFFNHEIPKIMIDISKMQQVFLNILLNAIEAIPEGGEIIIKTDICQERIKNSMNENWIQITIEDTGIGIKKEYMPFIFDPFYSKSKNKTGLGLSIVLSLIDQHNGIVKIDSEEGKGTTVTIYLPIT